MIRYLLVLCAAAGCAKPETPPAAGSVLTGADCSFVTGPAPDGGTAWPILCASRGCGMAVPECDAPDGGAAITVGRPPEPTFAEPNDGGPIAIVSEKPVALDESIAKVAAKIDLVGNALVECRARLDRAVSIANLCNDTLKQCAALLPARDGGR